MDGSNLLTAILCTTVSLVVGVILARVFPDRTGFEWGNVAEWLAALATVATAVFAGLALSAWRGQMRGTSRHAAAAEIAEAARLLKYYFYDARHPYVDTGEFPPNYRSLRPPISPSDKAEGWAYVFKNRYDLLYPQIYRLATLRAKAGVLLSEESATALGDLARKARELDRFFRDRVQQIKLGREAVDELSDPTWVQQTIAAIQVKDLDDHSDQYSLEFEEKFDSLMKSVKMFLL
jgi:hypothetical protein